MPTPAERRAIQARILGEVSIAKFWQSLLIALMLGIIGYGLYWEKFVGTFADFSTIFFWAFGLDIAVDAILKANPKKT